MKQRVHVSDHALLRYLERVGGFEIERLRREISVRLQPFAGVARGAVVIDGHAYVMDRNTDKGVVLVTVLPPGREYRGILTGSLRR
ncbi:hypothetical protein LO749_06420 [Paracoccus denitrificans]|uniref:hypothetical protein n=1 Tax=Paracoccus denitrificans TaxID=266 RepID=UPI001E3C5D5C|nr:hypothetical protein [Paracoccus denitrificans]UFS63821.1 hypothetical protein LO749_06420 [Paracoccus denitrificans]